MLHRQQAALLLDHLGLAPWEVPTPVVVMAHVLLAFPMANIVVPQEVVMANHHILQGKGTYRITVLPGQLQRPLSLRVRRISPFTRLLSPPPLVPPPPSSSLWAWVSCADMHITSQAYLFYQLTYLPQPISLAAMNGAVVGTGVAVGSIRFRAGADTTFDVHNILLVPSCKRNLLSGLQLAAAGLVMLGDSAGGGWRLVHDATGQVVAKYQRHDSSNQL